MLRPLLYLAAVAAIGLSACAGSAAPPSSSPADGGAAPVPSAPAGGGAADPGSGGGGAGGGGGTVGNPGTGIGVVPIDPTPIDPNAGEPKLVQPVPGRLNPHPVAPLALRTSVDGRHVLVKITWYGGVDPCSVLDSVKVERSGNDISLTPIEGSSDLNAMCIEIAVLKATIVDLGDLQPGTWRILAPGGDAPPVVLTID